MELEALTPAIEAILFAADKPVSLNRFVEVFGEEGPSKETLADLLDTLAEKYQAEDRGFEIKQHQGGYQFCTKKAYADPVRKFLESKPFRLGRTTLEVLSIIAYRQPITRAEIDNIRGIDSSHLLRTLIEKGVVKMAGKADVPGKPVQYATTPKFLELVGFNSLNDLPPLSELKELEGDTPDRSAQDVLEEGLEKFISTQITHTEKIQERDEGLEQIEALIDEAKQGASKEIYSSPVHAEVAELNQEALRGTAIYFKQAKKGMPALEADSGTVSEAESESETEAESESEPEAAIALDTPTPEMALEPEEPAKSEGEIQAAEPTEPDPTSEEASQNP